KGILRLQDIAEFRNLGFWIGETRRQGLRRYRRPVGQVTQSAQFLGCAGVQLRPLCLAWSSRIFLQNSLQLVFENGDRGALLRCDIVLFCRIRRKVVKLWDWSVNVMIVAGFDRMQWTPSE